MMTRTTNTATAWLSRLAVIPVAVAAFMLFTIKTEAQQQPATAHAQKAAMPKGDTAHRAVVHKNPMSRFIFSNFNYQHTQQGVSPELLTEYNTIVDKYEAYFSSALNSHGRNRVTTTVEPTKPSTEETARLKEIYGQMSQGQQNQQLVGFMLGSSRVLPRIVPTAKQFDAFKDMHTYGLWINGKKVDNTELDNYQPTDFAQVFVSKLYAAAAKGKIYKFQVDLMTTGYYDNYRRQTQANAKTPRMYCRTPPDAKQAGVFMF